MTVQRAMTSCKAPAGLEYSLRRQIRAELFIQGIDVELQSSIWNKISSFSRWPTEMAPYSNHSQAYESSNNAMKWIFSIAKYIHLILNYGINASKLSQHHHRLHWLANMQLQAIGMYKWYHFDVIILSHCLVSCSMVVATLRHTLLHDTMPVDKIQFVKSILETL